MKIIVDKNYETLLKNNFLSSGGEGDVYVKNRIAYKIYHDPGKVIPIGKINELSEVKNPNVITPINVIRKTTGKPIGYTMRYITDTYTLCQLFTKAFRNRNSLDHDKVQYLVKKLYTLIKDIHSANILIVDLNEMNFLAAQDFSEIYAIDTDSYQTKSFKATAIMESIRDRHSTSFSKETDWFSYGIISFQMFTGIHPYKGRHNLIKTIDERMQKNISVFSKDVSVPNACYSFDVIPEVYKNWYKAVFDDGKRIPPPSSFDSVTITVSFDTVNGTENIDINLIQECEGSILSVSYSNGLKVLTNKYLYLTNYKKIPVSSKAVIFSSPLGKTILAKLDNEKLVLLNANSGEIISSHIEGQDFMVSNDNLYIKSNDKVLFLELVEFGDNTITSAKVAATVLENSSKFFEGVLIQNLLGAFYLSFFPEASIHYQLRVKELDNYKIIDAKHDSGVLMVIAVDKNGIYNRLVFRFDKKYTSYDLRKINGITPIGINFVVLDSGIVVCINESDELEIFSRNKDSSSIKILNDNALSSDTKLFKSGANLLFSKYSKLYSAKMK